MKFLAKCIIALVVLPIIWLIQNASDKAINKAGPDMIKTWDEEDWIKHSSQLGLVILLRCSSHPLCYL